MVGKKLGDMPEMIRHIETILLATETEVYEIPLVGEV